jgi:hypothetical protein
MPILRVPVGIARTLVLEQMTKLVEIICELLNRSLFGIMLKSKLKLEFSCSIFSRFPRDLAVYHINLRLIQEFRTFGSLSYSCSKTENVYSIFSQHVWIFVQSKVYRKFAIHYLRNEA